MTSKPHSDHVATLRRVLDAFDAIGPKWRDTVVEGDHALNGLIEQYGTLRSAVEAWDATLSSYCDGPERDAVRAALSNPASEGGTVAGTMPDAGHDAAPPSGESSPASRPRPTVPLFESGDSDNSEKAEAHFNASDPASEPPRRRFFENAADPRQVRQDSGQ